MVTTRLSSVVNLSSCVSCERAFYVIQGRTLGLVGNWHPIYSRKLSLECGGSKGTFPSNVESTGLVNRNALRRPQGIVKEMENRLRVRSILEDKEDPIMSPERLAERLSDVPDVDICGGVIALGKFDALHSGHRALAEQAAKMGSPVLMSFSGMGEVLGWEPRLPVAAFCDRKRIMQIWAKRCGGVAPRECALEFAKVRSLSPREFVQKLSKELHVKGVVAGANYRFGYKAAGDASDLVHLCSEYGMQSFIVNPVMDKLEDAINANGDLSGTSREKGQISSTRVRKALAVGDMERVAKLLGRRHRLVLKLDNSTKDHGRLVIPVRSALNQFPKEGSYECALISTGRRINNIVPSGVDEGESMTDDLVGTAQVKIGPAWIDIVLSDRDIEKVLQRRLLGVEFCDGSKECP